MTRYAVVPMQGCYGSSTRVRPVEVTFDRRGALRRAGRMTAEFRAALKRYGGTTGGYRVVETSARTRRGVEWRGHELDLLPTVSP